MQLSTIELFCGTKSFSSVMHAHGHKTFTVDNDPQHGADLDINILALEASALPKRPDILWASPPCESFSVAAIGHNWNVDGTPKSERAVIGRKVVEKTIALIRDIGPKWWFIENPRGMLRKQLFMQGFHRVTITYCQYGDTRMKPTDIWTNATWWKPKAKCSPGGTCHEAAPRGSKTGTQGIVGAVDRGRIPAALFEEILAQMPQTIAEC